MQENNGLKAKIAEASISMSNDPVHSANASSVNKEVVEYFLPKDKEDSREKLTIVGSAEFVENMSQMLDIMVNSPTALKILKFNANRPTPLFIEEWENPLDLGRNTGTNIQIASFEMKKGKKEKISKYSWLGLVPHEFRHSFNAQIEKDEHILRAIAYAVTNEADAQAIGSLVLLEIEQHLNENKEKYPKEILDGVRGYLQKDMGFEAFKKTYEQSDGKDDGERKVKAVESFVKKWTNARIDGKPLSMLAYKTAIERSTSKDGWEKCSDSDFEELEKVLLGKIDSETVKDKSFMQGRKSLPVKAKKSQKEWTAFCQQLMDGTFNTDVIKYYQNIHPSNLINAIAPELAKHLSEKGVIPQTLFSKIPQAVGGR